MGGGSLQKLKSFWRNPFFSRLKRSDRFQTNFPINYKLWLGSERNFEGNPTAEFWDQFARSWRFFENSRKIGQTPSNFHLTLHVNLHENYLGISHLFPIFEVAMARRRIYREHQVSDFLQNFFRSRVYMSSSLKKICGASKFTLTSPKKYWKNISLYFRGPLLTSMERETFRLSSEEVIANEPVHAFQPPNIV